MPKVLIGNIAGPPGPNSIPTETFMANAITNPGVVRDAFNGAFDDEFAIDFASATARATYTLTTGSLAAAAQFTALLPFGSSYHLQRVIVTGSTTGKSRIRMYDTIAHRTADATTRAPGIDPDPATDHGVIFDKVFNGSYGRTLSPQVVGTQFGETGIPVLIDNLDAADQSLSIDFIFRKLEA